MAAEFSFDAKSNCVLIRFFDELTTRQFSELADRLKRLPEFAPGHLRLSDIRQLRHVPSANDVRKFAHIAKDLDHAHWPARTAILAGTDAAFGISRMFAMIRDPEGVIVRVCRNVPDAKEWLGLPSSPDDPFSPDNWGQRPISRVV